MTTTTDLTDYFIWFTKDCGNLSEAIRNAAMLAESDGTVNSHNLARAIGAEVTYVQHVLREAPHVCRHNIGDGRYRVHEAKTCGDDCDEKWAAHGGGPGEKVNACPGCGIHVPPAATECDFCGLDVAA